LKPDSSGAVLSPHFSQRVPSSTVSGAKSQKVACHALRWLVGSRLRVKAERKRNP
jgi:hypothetical protein